MVVVNKNTFMLLVCLKHMQSTKTGNRMGAKENKFEFQVPTPKSVGQHTLNTAHGGWGGEVL